MSDKRRDARSAPEVARLARLRARGRQPPVLSIDVSRAELLGDSSIADHDFAGSLHAWMAVRDVAPGAVVLHSRSYHRGDVLSLHAVRRRAG